MEHLTDDQLILDYYGEGAEGAAVQAHLAECADCREQRRAWQALLNTVESAPVPERGPEYETAVWRTLRPKLGRSRRRFWWTTRHWGLAAALAALLVAAFLAGRHTAPVRTIANAGEVRERVLLVALGDHLERSQMILIDLANAPDERIVDISAQQRAADELLDQNRLYRQTAARQGDGSAAAVLDELERVLLDVAHGPAKLTPEQAHAIRQRIEDAGVLFQVRVLGEQIRQREEAPRQRL